MSLYPKTDKSREKNWDNNRNLGQYAKSWCEPQPPQVVLVPSSLEPGITRDWLEFVLFLSRVET